MADKSLEQIAPDRVEYRLDQKLASPDAPPAAIAAPTETPTGFEPGQLDALMNQYADPPKPEAGSSSSISLGVPVFRSSPEERSGAEAKTVAAIEALKGTLKDSPELAAQKEKQRKGITQDFQGKSAQNYQTSQDLINEHVKPLQAEADRLAIQHQQAVDARDQYQTRMQGAIEQMDTLGKRVAADQPRDFWADQSTGMKLATIALSGLGGATMALNGDRTNAITDTIDNMVKRDVAMQKMRFEKNAQDYGNQQTLVGQLASHFDRLEHAQDAAYITGMQGVTGRLQALKPMLDSAQMRQNVDMQIAQLEMKSVDASTKLQENLLGKAVRIGEVVTKTAVDEQKMKNAADNAKLTAGQKVAAEQRLAAKETRLQSSLEVPGWTAPNGVKASPQEVTKLRGAETTTRKVSASMDNLVKELDRVSPSSLLSTDAYREYKQSMAALIEAARGEGFGQTGSRLTEMLKELEESAFTPGALGRMTPQESKKLLRRAQANIWNTVKDAMAERGFAPIEKGPGHHDIFGEE